MGDNLSETELAKRLAEAEKHVVVGGEYLHYKNKRYTVLNVALLESTTEVCVIYQAQYGERLTFIRPLSIWTETIIHDGKTVQRFEVCS